jgi:hypothetical protein
MPLFLLALELPEKAMRANVIETLLSVGGDDARINDVISEHAPALVSAMLKNCMLLEMPSVVGAAI